MNIPLGKLISNLQSLKDEGVTKVAEKEIKDIFYIVLYEMAVKTIVDTGQARSAIIDEFASKNGYPVGELFNEVYDYWGKKSFPENASRHRHGANTKYTEVFDGKKSNVRISINDKGLYEQENANAQGVGSNGHLYPSEVHSQFTGRNNSEFVPRPIQRVTDSWMNNPEIEKLMKEICIKIEKFIFK